MDVVCVMDGVATRSTRPQSWGRACGSWPGPTDDDGMVQGRGKGPAGNVGEGVEEKRGFKQWQQHPSRTEQRLFQRRTHLAVGWHESREQLPEFGLKRCLHCLRHVGGGSDMHVRDESGSDSGRVHVHIVVHVMRARVHVLACAHAHACASACCERPQGRRGRSIDSWCRDHRTTGLGFWCTFRGRGDRSLALTFTGEEGTSFASRVVPTCAATLFCDVPASRGGREAKWSLGVRT